jgi:hypothetical protein
MAVQFPKMIALERRYELRPSFDFLGALSRRLTEKEVIERLKPNQRVAIAVGSRGISNLNEIVSVVVETVKSKGALPYIVPAMGSHGGATPEGQTHVLAEYGITQTKMGVPIDARMGVLRLGLTENNVEVYCSEAALVADAIIVINRIKPHTNFQGAIGSGIMKMLAIGLGKHKGAEVCHAAAARLGYEPVLRAVASFMLSHAPVLCGIAIIEDQKHQIADIDVFLPDSVERDEEVLFARAKGLMPTLPFHEIDLLIIDLLGKDISGAGIDPNVIGRSVFGYSTGTESNGDATPKVRHIFVRDLSPATGGNALGIGLADSTTSRVVKKMDLRSTYANAVTSLLLACAKIPIYFDTDRETLAQAIVSLALPTGTTPRILRIESTLALSRFQAAVSYSDEIRGRGDLVITTQPHEMEFDANDNLLPL